VKTEKDGSIQEVREVVSPIWGREPIEMGEGRLHKRDRAKKGEEDVDHMTGAVYREVDLVSSCAGGGTVTSQARAVDWGSIARSQSQKTRKDVKREKREKA